ncbi:MAG TPA: SRPBCC domain-containing protein [Vicinamibacterales bacterium]|nr:SRPBCC domain-containing protein [Vicinamibacterales bacterium]
MSDPLQELGQRFEQTLVVAATPEAVFNCFFSADALRAWWQAVRSVTTPVPLGVYAVEWATTPYRDDLLGPLGGVFHGTVIEVRPPHSFLVADAFWIPPEGAPLGPMALHVTCDAEGTGCKLHVRQDGYEPSPRWRRYYAVVSRGWQISLTALKRYAEAPPAKPAPRDKDKETATGF